MSGYLASTDQAVEDVIVKPVSKHFLIFLLLVFVQAGCASLPVYGNFCGPGHPSIDETLSTEEQVAKLEEIKVKLLEDGAEDSVDLACKKHDICYTQGEKYFAKTCDDQLFNTLVNKDIRSKTMEGERPLSRRCLNLFYDFSSYFAAPLISKSDDSSLTSEAVRMPFAAAGLAVHATTAPLMNIGSPSTLIDRYPNDDEICVFVENEDEQIKN